MSRHGLEIRAAAASDAPFLSDLLGIPPAVLAERLATVRRDEGVVLIAVEWGPPSGIVAVHWYNTLTSGPPTARITTLLVAPEQRRRGLARLLVKTAAQAARAAGCEVFEMAVPPAAEGLEAFCLASGFVTAGGQFVRGLRRHP